MKRKAVWWSCRHRSMGVKTMAHPPTPDWGGSTIDSAWCLQSKRLVRWDMSTSPFDKSSVRVKMKVMFRPTGFIRLLSRAATLIPSLNYSQVLDSGIKTQGAESCYSNRSLNCQGLWTTFSCDSSHVSFEHRFFWMTNVMYSRELPMKLFFGSWSDILHAA